MASNVLCEPCFTDNQGNSAVNWCIECDEVLCLQCSNHHKLAKALRNHKLVDVKQKGSYNFLGILSSTCDKHPDQEVEYFCTDHDRLCCRECIATKHKSCPNTFSLESASKGVKRSVLFFDCSAKISAMLDTVTKVIESNTNNYDELEKLGTKIRDKIKHTKELIILRINKIEENLVEKLNKIIEVESKKLRKDKEEILWIKEYVESHQREVAFIRENVSEKQAFMCIRKMNEDLSSTEKDMETKLKTLKDIYIMYHRPNKVDPMLSMSLGSINVIEEPCPITYKSPMQQHAQIQTTTNGRNNHFQLEEKIDVTGRVITGMAITENNQIILCDASCYSNVVIVLNENNKFVKEINMAGCPWNIAVIPKTTNAVVTFGREVIQFLDTEILVAGKMISLGYEGQQLYGIDATVSNILVGTKGNILVLSVDGFYLRRLKVNCGVIQYIHAEVDGSYYYFTDLKRYCCVKQNGNPVFTASLDKEGIHRCLQIDKFGHVYVVGQTTSTIYRLYNDGSPNRIVLNEDYGIKKPSAICFNDQVKRLYVANFGTDALLVFRYR